MAGVPGRLFKGCKTCRRRKKKCTLERPICHRCKKSGFVCGGYDVERVFVNSTTTPGGVVVVRQGPIIELPHSLNLSAYSGQYLGMFWDIYLPNSGPIGCKLGGQYPTTSWLTVAKDLHTQSSAVRESLLAVCLMLIGQRDKRQWMIIESLRLYTSALDGLISSLRNHSTMAEDAMLVASRALATYELVGSMDTAHSSDWRPQSWNQHNQGQVALLTRRTPEHYMHGQPHRLLADGRVQVIIAACVNNKRCFLAEPAWTTVPWTYTPKSPREYLIDVFAQCPGLLEVVNLLTTHQQGGGDCKDDTIALRTRKAYARMYADLNAWKDTYFPFKELDDLRSRARARHSDKDNDNDHHIELLQKHQHPEPTSTDILAAHLVTMFWTTSLVMHNTMRVACATCPDIDPDPEWTQSWTKQGLDQYCTDIAGVIGVLLHPSAGVFWSQYAIFPVSCSLRYLTTTQQLRSETADKLLNIFSVQMNREALMTFILGAVRTWPGFGSWNCEFAFHPRDGAASMA